MKYNIIIPDDVLPYPDKYEIRSAMILSRYFKFDVRFIRRENNKNTPDIEINGVKWEIKSPKGSAKSTIPNQFRRAKKQSDNLCLDLHRIKLPEAKAIVQSRAQFHEQKKFKSLIIIKKSGEILVI